MKYLRITAVTVLISLITACNTFPKPDEYSAIKPEAISKLISVVQESVRLSAGSLKDANITLEKATLTFGVTNIVKSETGIGVLVLTAKGNIQRQNDTEISIELSHKPLDLLEYKKHLTKAYENKEIEAYGEASTKGPYVILNSKYNNSENYKDEIDSSVGALTATINTLVSGLSKADNDHIPLFVESATITLGIIITTDKEGGIAGIEFAKIKLGSTIKNSSENTNKLTIKFKKQ